MRTRIVLCAGIVLCLAGVLHAATTVWYPALGSNLWSEPNNWSVGLPTTQDKAKFAGPGECIVDFEGAETNQLDVSGGPEGPLKIVDGGRLTVYDWAVVGYYETSVGEYAGYLEVLDGGVIDLQKRIYVGNYGEGHLTVYEGGTVNIHSEYLAVGRKAGGTGFVELEGGSVNIFGSRLESLILYSGVSASINFRGGALTYPDTTENQDYLNRAIGDGIIKAYDGVGEVVTDPNETPGRIIIRGVHPLKPFPADDSVATTGDVDLSWVLPDPCQPGTPVTVDVYFGTSPDVGSAECPKIIDQQSVTSVSVNTEAKTRYYWAVDTYIGSPADPVWGPLFSFVADNLPPKVDAGKDVVTTWLADGVRTGNLDATVTDDGKLVPYTVQWTVVSEPNDPNSPDAVIADSSAEDTSITLAALGEYVLQLDAFDGEYTGSDTVTINVYNDSCEAAQSLPDYVPFVGDLNGDCMVDDVDMALLQEDWLKDNSLTEEW